jgi:NADPH-dependent F420 reductase
VTDRLILTLGIIGGTGKEGRGLAGRWAKAGYHVIIGSRSIDKALESARDVNGHLGSESVRGMINEEAARTCDIAVLTVPFAAHAATLQALREPLQGKVVVDVTVPVIPPDVTVVRPPGAGSAAQEAQLILGPKVQVVSAFQNVSHTHLAGDHPVPCDVLVSGDSQAARDQVLHLVSAAGLVGWDAGPLPNSIAAEALTAVLVGINKRYKISGAGIRITGEPKPSGG